ncbi:MAG: serine protease [bacterium]|nr:serine protease [bacterium]
MSSKSQTGKTVKGTKSKDESPACNYPDSDKKLLAFEVAEEAKRHVVNWAKWIIGTVVFIFATLGVKTFLDVQMTIRNRSNEHIKTAEEKINEALKEFEGRTDSAITKFEEFIGRAKRDVLEKKRIFEIETLSAAPKKQGKQKETRTVARKSRQRPIGPGLSVSTMSTTAGTICCIVKDKKGYRFILTAKYIAGSGDPKGGGKLIQPGRADGGKEEDAVAIVKRFSKSAVIAQIKDDVSVYYDIPEIGYITGIAGQPNLGDIVKKYGRTTGLTLGIVIRIYVTAKLNMGGNKIEKFKFFEVSPIEGDAFSMGGDGGAPVLNSNNELVGMHFAGTSESGVKKKISQIIPIKIVLDELGVEVVKGQ